MHVEAGVRPRQHSGGLLLIEPLDAHEEPEHGAAEGLGQPCGVVGGPSDGGAVRPNPAAGHEEVHVRMPAGPRALRLHTGHNADREVALARRRLDRARDGAGGGAGDLAEQTAPIDTGGAEPLRDGEHHLPVRHRREQVFVRTVVTANTREPVVASA
jgi:hypothetical protein